MPATDSLIVEQVPLDQLKPDPANPRRIGDAELDALTRSVSEWGLVLPIIARRADGVVIGGHQRLIAARRLGNRTVPVIWLDLSPERARLLGLALNKISGSWDEQLLARLVADLDALPDTDLTLTGFGEDELQNLLRSFDAREKRDRPETFDLDVALGEATKQPRAKPGDLWLLGDHRILCGDATQRQDVGRLLGAPAREDGVHRSALQRRLRTTRRPPAGSPRRTIVNDALEPDAWEAFVRAWGALLLGSTDGAIYVCMSSKEWPTVARVLAEEGGHWSDTIIWTKDRFVLGRADYQRRYELLWYGWNEGAQRYWCGDRDQSDVWEIARPATAPLHPIMKPLALMERAISNSSQPRDTVLDLFLGSGSTLIACERTDRKCAALELEPVYVDVALARWERFSGGVAVRADG